MNFSRVVCALSACLLVASLAIAQQDVERKTVAITYPLDETVTVKFRRTTLLPRLKGEAKVKRAGRRGTRVELSVEDLPRASELGGIYTTYVLWAISPDGHVDNLGEIKRGGSGRSGDEQLPDLRPAGLTAFRIPRGASAAARPLGNTEAGDRRNHHPPVE